MNKFTRIYLRKISISLGCIATILFSSYLVAGQEIEDRNSYRYVTELSKVKSECKQGVYKSCFDAAELYRHGQSVKRDYNLAQLFYEKGCSGRDRLSCYMYASSLLEGDGFVANADKAEIIFNDWCNLGDIEFCQELAYIYGRKGEKSREAELYRKVCEGGMSDGCSELVEVYELEQDYIKAQEYAIKSCYLGNQFSCHSAAEKYQAGSYGRPKNLLEAKKLFEYGCKLGNQKSCDMANSR